MNERDFVLKERKKGNCRECVKREKGRFCKLFNDNIIYLEEMMVRGKKSVLVNRRSKGVI